MIIRYPPFFDDNPFGIYEKILAGRVNFPSHFDPSAKDLVKKLLTADRSKRLGNLKNGAADVKNHKWFKGIDWQGLINKALTVRKLGLGIPYDHVIEEGRKKREKKEKKETMLYSRDHMVTHYSST